MSSRVGKRKRRVAEAEAALVNHRLALREQLHVLAGDARAAATPGRIVVGGFALGALVGLVTGRKRNQPGTQTAAKPGMLQSLTGMVRLVSMLMPMLGPLMTLAQGAVPGQDTASGGAAGHAAPEDPLA